MEFADAPNFSIAAVTDWTAAGGHGSDASLRTSEALNREALTLKPEKPAIPASEVTETEKTLQGAAKRAPQDFTANRRLGEFYLGAERYPEAIQPLEIAYKADPSDSKNEYDLALALTRSGDAARAREHVQKLMEHDDSADAHRLEGEICEQLNDPLGAVREFERAVRQDPSEQNYFAWGSELLLHRAIWQAKDVFSRAVKAYPESERMITALGATLFAAALYDDAARSLCQASDLKPSDPEPYMFMGKIEIAAPTPLPCVEQKLARFADQNPGNPLANYFYAMAVWKEKGNAIDPATLDRVQAMLAKAVTIDPRCAEAYLQLGVLEATRRDFAKATEFYAKALEVNPQMSEAHYRLGVALDRLGRRIRQSENSTCTIRSKDSRPRQSTSSAGK